MLSEQADDALAACDEAEEQIRKLQQGIEMLDEKARSIMLILTDPLLDPSRWQGPEATNALKRALKLLVHDLILRERRRASFTWRYNSMKFVKVCCTRARGNRTHQRSSSLRPTVLKTAAATGPHASALVRNYQKTFAALAFSAPLCLNP